MIYQAGDEDSPENSIIERVSVKYWIEGEEFERDVFVDREDRMDRDVIREQLPRGVDDFEINN